MKKTLVSLLLILSSLASFVPAQAKRQTAAAVKAAAAKPQTVYAIPMTSRTLSNGMQIIVLQDNSVPLVTIEFAVRNGSFTEPPELNGLSHLYEHMFFKTNHAMMLYKCEHATGFDPGAFRRGDCANELKLKPEIKDVDYVGPMSQLGMAENGRTQEEVVEYYFSTTTPHIAPAMKYIRDAARFPLFDEDEFTREKEVVIGELDRHMSEPFYYLNQAMLQSLFYKYPSRKSPEGTRETVASATTEKMRLIQSRYYQPNNSALVVTGVVKPDAIFAMAEQLYGDWPRAEDPFVKFPLVEHPPLDKSKGIIVNQPVQNVLFAAGWHGPSIGKDDAASYAADVFSFIIRQPDSRFQRALVDSGLASFVNLGYYTQRNVGPIQVFLSTSPDKAKAAVKALYNEIDQFNKPDYFTDEELANAKNLLEADDLYGREKLSDYTHTLAFWWSSTGIDYFRDYHKNLRAVGRPDIARYISTYIQNKPHVGLALISTEDQAAAGLTPDDLTGGK